MIAYASENLNVNILLASIHFSHSSSFFSSPALKSPQNKTLKPPYPGYHSPSVNRKKSGKGTVLNPCTIVRHIHASHQSLQQWRGDIAVTDFTDVAVALGKGRGTCWGSCIWKMVECLGQEPASTYVSSFLPQWRLALKFALTAIFNNKHMKRASQPENFKMKWLDLVKCSSVIWGLKPFAPFSIACFFVNS